MSYTPNNPNGQTTMANSAPVVLASDHSPIKLSGYDQQDDMLKVKSVQKKFRDSFTGAAVDSTKWDVTLGTGGTATVASGQLTFGSGTTVSATSTILSKEMFTVPFRLSLALSLSQRIANQTFYVEAVSVNPTTGVPDGQHSCGYAFDGTNAVQAKYFVQNGGLAALVSGASTIPTTASGSVYEIEPFSDEAWFHGGVLDSSAGRANSYRRHQQIPDPNAVYKIRLRWVNNGTAPASNTNAVMQFVACQDYAELTAEITAGRGQIVAGQALGVAVTNTVSAAQSGTWTVQPGNTANTTAWLVKPAESLGTATALGALNAEITQALNGNLGTAATITAVSTPTGIVLTPYASYDGGTNWITTQFFNSANGDAINTLSSFAVGNAYSISAGDGATHVKVRATSWTSGSVTVRLSSTNSQGLVNLKATAVHDDPAGSFIIQNGAIASATAPTAVADGDAVRLWATTSGALNIADGGSSITVDGTVATTQSGTWNVGLSAGNNNIGDVDVASLPGTVAADITAIKTAVEVLDNTVSGNELQVDIITSALPTGAATSAKQDTMITALQLIDDAVGTDGAAVATGMLRVGGTDGINNQTISVTTAGAVNIADGGNSITVDNGGTFAVQAAQSGTWTVQPGNTANTTPWLTKISDGTNAAAIKAASTAAVAADPALVVTVSPNNAVTVVQPTASNLNATVTGTVELGSTSLAALENISVTVPGTVDLGTISLTALETITVEQSTANNFKNKPHGAVTTAAPSYTNGTDAALSLTTEGALRTSIMSALPAGNNNIGDVDVASLPALPAGTNNIGTVEIGATSLAALETINAAQSGTWTVGLSAGSNAIGKLAANAGVIIGAVEIAPATTNAPSNATTTAYAASLIIKASAGTVYSITGYNSKTSAQFIQLHDSATLPADAAVPKVIFYVPAQSNFAFDLTPYGRSFAAGIVVCNSSTGPTKTIGSADCWFDVQYK